MAAETEPDIQTSLTASVFIVLPPSFAWRFQEATELHKVQL